MNIIARHLVTSVVLAISTETGPHVSLDPGRDIGRSVGRSGRVIGRSGCRLSDICKLPTFVSLS